MLSAMALCKWTCTALCSSNTPVAPPTPMNLISTTLWTCCLGMGDRKQASLNSVPHLHPHVTVMPLHITKKRSLQITHVPLYTCTHVHVHVPSHYTCTFSLPAHKHPHHNKCVHKNMHTYTHTHTHTQSKYWEDWILPGASHSFPFLLYYLSSR